MISPIFSLPKLSSLTTHFYVCELRLIPKKRGVYLTQGYSSFVSFSEICQEDKRKDGQRDFQFEVKVEGKQGEKGYFQSIQGNEVSL